MMQLQNTENITSTMGTIGNSLFSQQRRIQALPDGCQPKRGDGVQPIICCMKRRKLLDGRASKILLCRSATAHTTDRLLVVTYNIMDL